MQTPGVGLRLRKALKSNQAATQCGTAKHPACTSYRCAPPSCVAGRGTEPGTELGTAGSHFRAGCKHTAKQTELPEQTCGLWSSTATSENKNTNACLLLKLFYNVGYI